MKKAIVTLLAAAAIEGTVTAQDRSVPPEFVLIKDAIPTIVLDMRYAGTHNFMGRVIDGYLAPVAYLTRAAADSLSRVQEELIAMGLSLKIYDAYRPQRAVDHFVRWAEDLDDTAAGEEFYPYVQKKDLFSEGYISARSGHTRGSTLDLTIVPWPAPEEPEFSPDSQQACTEPAGVRFDDNSLDMGTGYDCFDVRSGTADSTVGPRQRAHRLLLKSLMERHGFRNYPGEWWHYTLVSEPFPDTYFDFPVQ